jgi:hypothetical protein
MRGNVSRRGSRKKRSTRLKAANDDSVSLYSMILALAPYGRDGGTCYGFLLVYSHETQLRSLSIYPSTSALFPVPPMSSKRGRKRNDNLPPNRARDVQRAFRARRAAHLDVRNPSLFYFKPCTFLIFLSHVYLKFPRLPRSPPISSPLVQNRHLSSASKSSRKKMATFERP